MSYRVEKNGDEEDLVFEGWETGIAPSPHKGTANIQNGNISTETGEVTASFSRIKQTQAPIVNGTLTASAGLGTTKLSTSSPLQAGQWINISSTNIQYTYSPLVTTVNSFAVGGGGAGGGSDTNAATHKGGGGSGGQVASNSSLAVGIQAYTVTVGAGGTGVSNANGNDGNDTTIGSLVTAVKGRGGGKDGTNGVNGYNGGGAGRAATGGTGTNHAGGDGASGTGAAGGGAGDGAIGSNGAALVGGNGGTGTVSSISGSSVTYADGGGGGGNTGGTGGSGNGGTGASASGAGGNAVANTGSGGGGAITNGGGDNPYAGGNGSTGIVIIKYPTSQLTATGGTITTGVGNTTHTFTTSGTFTVTAITSITITLPTGAYYVDYVDTNGNIKLSNSTPNAVPISTFDPNAAFPLVHATSGTATFSTSPNMGALTAKATERYFDGTTSQYRYYVLDSAGLVWVYDTGLYASSLASTGVGTTWFLPDTNVEGTGSVASGIGVLNGWLFLFTSNVIYAKETTRLGNLNSNSTTYLPVKNNTVAALLNSAEVTDNIHFALSGHQGRLYWTDGNYVGSLFPDVTLLSGAPSANIQSYGQYTGGNTTCTLTASLSGSVPFDPGGSRIPVVFFSTGSIPASLASNAPSWIGNFASDNTFSVYAASSGGSALDMSTGATGTQYFNTFYPVGSFAVAAGQGSATCTISTQRVNLPAFEKAKCLVEVGNTVLIGCTGSVVYPWSQVKTTPDSLINLPEADVTTMVTVNQMAYIFAGNNGNVYITDGSTASLVINIPDYCAGVPGSPGTYIEPNYYWKDAMYLRGRVYFSIRDQTATKAGNCGGIWSFVPTQNLYIGQDTGIALRLEAQNSYLTYSGFASLLVPAQVQDMTFPLYWSPWTSDFNTPTYGIDYSNGGTLAGSTTIIETDLAPVGTILNKKTFKQVEYKLSAPLDVGATVTAQYRVNGTNVWTACDTFITDTDLLSGYVRVNFEKLQWLQLRVTLTPITSSADSNTFVRFKEIRVR